MISTLRQKYPRANLVSHWNTAGNVRKWRLHSKQQSRKFLAYFHRNAYTIAQSHYRQ